MNEEFLKNIHTAHFIGIGGIGVSAVARLMLSRGVKVSGSDRDGSPLTEKLDEEGVKVFVGHDRTHVPDKCDLVVYSPAIPESNPELLVARERGVQTLSYPEALGMISRGMKTIAVSGTHGKTTTTAMIAEVLVGTHKNPTVIVGSILKSGSNFIAGKSNLFVVEACEYKRSFLQLSPEILVITNIDNDHLDYYGDIQGVQKAFAEMVEKVPRSGAIICNPNDPFVAPVLAKAVAQIIDYELATPGSPLLLSVPGDHNIRNAKAALSVARILGVDENEAIKLLGQFTGTWRRMEYKGQMPNGALVYDDYAHHPTEVKATLQGFRAKFPDHRIWVIFQPHLYSRTKLLLKDFAKSFGDANEVIIAPIYAAREAPDPSITIDVLVWEIAKNHYSPRAFGDFASIEKHLRDSVLPGDIVITMGAGDIYKVGEQLLG